MLCSVSTGQRTLGGLNPNLVPILRGPNNSVFILWVYSLPLLLNV